MASRHRTLNLPGFKTYMSHYQLYVPVIFQVLGECKKEGVKDHKVVARRIAKAVVSRQQQYGLWLLRGED